MVLIKHVTFFASAACMCYNTLQAAHFLGSLPGQSPVTPEHSSKLKFDLITIELRFNFRGRREVLETEPKDGPSDGTDREWHKAACIVL